MDFHDEYEDFTSTTPRRPRHAAQVPDELAEDILRRLAAMRVRRQCNQHRCTAADPADCTDPNHRRDADLLLSTDAHHPGMLDMLGLDTSYPQYTEAERQTWLRWIGNAPAADQAA